MLSTTYRLTHENSSSTLDESYSKRETFPSFLLAIARCSSSEHFVSIMRIHGNKNSANKLGNTINNQTQSLAYHKVQNLIYTFHKSQGLYPASFVIPFQARTKSKITCLNKVPPYKNIIFLTFSWLHQINYLQTFLMGMF